MLIAYGSLYPWHFQNRYLPANPLWILLHAWHGPFDRRFFADVLVNVALYVPLGMAGYLAFRRRRVAGPVALGTLLSACIEMMQLYTPGRSCSAIDLMDNIAGCAVGTLTGFIFEQIVLPVRSVPGEIRRLQPRRILDRSALALLFCWVAWMLFPFFPVMRLMTFDVKLAAFRSAPWWEPVSFLSATVSWFVAGRMLRAVGLRSPQAWLGASLLLLPAQFLMVTRMPAPAEFPGAIAGFALFCLWGNKRGAGEVAAGVLLLLLTLRGLVPFHPGTPHQFLWMPFDGFLRMNWQSGIQVLLEKLFFYGAMIWTLRAAGVRLWVAAVITVTLLAAIEGFQTLLPDRTGESTDPLLALLIWLGFRAVDKLRRQRLIGRFRGPLIGA